MKPITQHISKCFVAGIVALLPIAGTVFSIVYIEQTIANSWLARQPWYFPGMGILAAAAVIYLIGLTVSSLIGRFFWTMIDTTLDRLPALGSLYRTLKQVLGYGEGDDGMFQEVVLVPSREHDACEIGLVTQSTRLADDNLQLTVFIPGAPMPTAGRLILIDERHVQRVDMKVADSLRAIVSVGKTDMPQQSTPFPKLHITQSTDPSSDTD